MANTTTLNETLRSPIDGTEFIRLATSGANWKAQLGTQNWIFQGVFGGNGTGSTLTLGSTTGAGATDSIVFQTGSQVNRAQFDTNGILTVLTNTNSTASTNGCVVLDGGLGVAGNLNVGGGQNSFGSQSLSGRTLTISTSGQPTFAFNETSAGVGNKVMGIIYDGGVSLSAPGMVFQNLDDTGTFVANNMILWRDGGATFGGGVSTTSPGAGIVVIPTLAGGSTASSSLVIESTTAAGTTDAIIFKTGSQVQAAIINTTQQVIVSPSSTAVNVASTGAFQVNGTNVNQSTMFTSLFSNDAIPCFLTFYKSRGATVGTTTAVQTNDEICRINFYEAISASATGQAATISAFCDGTPSSTSSPGRLSFGTTASGATAVTARLLIDSFGFVAIGTGGGQVGSSTNNTLQVAADGSINNVLNCIAYNSASTGISTRFDMTAGSTPGTQSLIGANAVISQWRFRGSDGTQQQSAAIFEVDADGTPAAGSMPGKILLYTTPASSTTPAERFRIDKAGNVIINTAAIATNATDGFLYVETCAGTPTGTPTTYTGRVPIVFDTTNSQFWIFTGGAWKQPKTPAAAAIVTWQ